MAAASLPDRLWPTATDCMPVPPMLPPAAPFDLARKALRVQLALLVLAIALPAFGVAIWYLQAQREESRQVARDKVKILVDNAADRISANLRVHEILLAQIATQPLVRAMNSAACDPLIREYARLHPEYVAIGTRDPQGNPVCTYQPSPPTQDVVMSYPWFQASQRSEGFRASGVFFAPQAKRWVTVLTMPVRNDAGRRNGLVVLPLDLLALSRLVLGGMPANAVVTVLDAQSNILLRSVDPELWISKPAPPGTAQDTRTEGFATRVGADGVRRVIAFKGVAGPGWRVAAGLPEDEVFAAADSALRNGLLGCTLLLLAALALAWRLALGIVRPLDALAATTARVAAGDVSARVPVVDGPAELEAVAQAFNHMLDSLATAQAALRETNSFSRQVIESLPLGLNVRDMQGRYVEWNPAMARIARIPAGTTLGRTMADAYPEQPREAGEAIMQALERAMRGEMVVRPDLALNRDGEVQWTSASHAPVRNAQGGIVGVLSIVQDITARKAAEQALRQSEENLAITLQSIGDAVIATDARGKVTRMNPVAERLTGWTLAQASGQALGEVFRIVNAETRERVPDPVQTVLRSGRVVGLANHTTLMARGGPEYQIADSAAPIRDSTGTMVGVVLVFSDVSEQYRMQRELVENEHRYRALIEGSPVGVYVHQEGNTLYVNPAAVRIFGAGSASELLAGSMLERVHPDYRAGVLERMRINLEQQTPSEAHEEKFL